MFKCKQILLYVAYICVDWLDPEWARNICAAMSITEREDNRNVSLYTLVDYTRFLCTQMRFH